MTCTRACAQDESIDLDGGTGLLMKFVCHSTQNIHDNVTVFTGDVIAGS